MKYFEEFYVRNKKIFEKLGIVKNSIESKPYKELDLSSTSDIDNFINDLSNPRFLGGNFGRKNQIRSSDSFAGILKNQISNNYILKKANWILFNPLVKILIILWGIFNLIMLILLLF